MESSTCALEPTARDLMTIAQAAEYCPAFSSHQVVRRLITAGEIPVVRLGGRVLVVRQDLDAIAPRSSRTKSS